MAFEYLEYQYPYAHLFHKELLWLNKNCNCYFAFKLNDEDDWTFYAGNGSHALATGKYLTSYGTVEASAAANYVTTTRDANGKFLAMLPTTVQAKYARVYIETGSSVSIYEWQPSVYVTAHDIVSGTLEITDDLSDAPLIKVTASSHDRVKIGKVGNYYGMFGYDGSDTLLFELSDYRRWIAGFSINEGGLVVSYSGNTSGISAEATTFYSGPTGAPTFTVTREGVLTSTAGYIGGAANGWQISAGKLTSLGSGVIETNAAALSGIKLDSASLRIYNGSVQTGELAADGSGWFGLYATRSISWDTSGNVTIAGFAATATSLHAGTASSRIQLDTLYGIHLGATAFADAPFRVSLAGNLTATNADISGTISATAGSIGGFTIDVSLGLYSGSGSEAVHMQPGVGIWTGASSFGDAPFSVSNAGVLTATLGTIGGFTITSSALYVGSDVSRIQLDTAAGIHLGATAFADAPFRVSLAGAMTAYSGVIGGFTITSTMLYAGSESTIIRLDTEKGIWLGGDALGDAPFSVTNAGVLTAESGTIGGFTIATDYLTAGSGFSRIMFDTAVGIHLGADAFVNAPFSVSLTGSLKATSGTVGGFSLTDTTLTATDVLIDSANQKIVLGSANAIVALDAGDSTYRIAIGHETYSLAPFSVTKLGAITATSGTVGGFTLASDKLYAGSGATRIQFDIANGIHFGSDEFADAPFSVTPAGAVKATSGVIGGFTLGTYTFTASNLLLDTEYQRIKLGSGNDLVTLDAADAVYRIVVGHADYGSAPFAVKKDGTLILTSANIAGWTIDSTSIKDAAGMVGLSSVAEAGVDIRFWAGHTTPTSAPFQVYEDGSVYASDIYIQGAISGGTIDIGGADASSFHVDEYGNIWSGAALFIDAPFSVTNAGVMTAASGSVGGWGIDSSRIYKEYSILHSDGYLSFGETPPTAYGDYVGVWIGFDLTYGRVSLYSDANNYFRWDGSLLTIKAANFALDALGSITANAGVIGGFTISSTDGLYAGTDVSRVQMKADSGIWAGATAIGDAPFSVTSAGVLTAKSGTVGGWGLSSTSIYKDNSVLSSTGYAAFGATPPSSYGNNQGAWLGYASGYAKLSLYADASNYFQWDGTKALINAANFTLDSDGKITAVAGVIAGFTFDSTEGFYVGSGSTRIQMKVGAGIWAGATLQGDAPFSVTNAGVIVAKSGTIAGFTIDSVEGIYAGANTTRVQMKPAVGFWAGATNYDDAYFSVSAAGALKATSGVIGGFTITSSALYAGSNSTRVQLDTSSGIHLGATAFANAPFSVSPAGVLTASSGTIGGCYIGSDYLSSTTYVSGMLGKGWAIYNTGLAEFQNAVIRGRLITTVFEKQAINIVNGILMVTKGDVLAVDMTAGGTTLTINGACTFETNEILRIKDGFGGDEWLQVTDASAAPTYTVTRDLANAYPAGTEPAWTKGQPVASFSVTNQGFLELDGSSTFSPVLTVHKRYGSGYNDYTPALKIGKLDGFLGIPSNSYGIAIGTGDQYLKYYADLGLQIKGNIDASTITASSITSSDIVGGSIRTAILGKRIEMTSTGMTLYMEGDVAKWDGTDEWDGEAEWGPNIRAYLYNTGTNVPLYFNSASIYGDIHYYDRTSDPTGAAEVGDTCVVNGVLKICTVPGTPGTWTIVGSDLAELHITDLHVDHIGEHTGSHGIVFDNTVTLPASTIVPDGGTIGQAAGPLITFDDTNNYLEITGCNVGIGMTTPSALLTIYGTPAVTSGALINARDSSATGSNTTFGGIFFNSAPGTDFAVGKKTLNSTGYFQLRTGAGVELVTVDGSGNVGIGTTDPSIGGIYTSKFTVVSAATAIAAAYNTTTPSFALNPQSDSSWLLYDYYGSSWNAGISQKGGYVGIGVAAPASILELQESVAAGAATLNIANMYSLIGNLSETAELQFNFRVPTSVWYGNAKIVSFKEGDYATSNWNLTGGLAFYTRTSTAGAGTLSEKMRITAAGNVGIGTTSPNSKFEVYTGADTTQILWGQNIRNEGNADTTGYGAGLKLKISSEGSPNELNKWVGVAAVAGTGYSNRTDMAFYVSPTCGAGPLEKVRITGDGNVGIGTTSPEIEFHINDSTGNSAIRLSGGAANNETYQLQQGIDGISNGGFAIRDVTNSINRFVIQYSTGYVGIGNTSPSTKLDVNGTVTATAFSGPLTGNVTGNASTATNAYGLLASSDKEHYLGESSNWDGIGFANLTNLHFQGHSMFWIGAGNSTWYGGAATSYNHDLLLTTMYSDGTYTRGITFAVDNAGAGTSGWRLGRWLSGTSSATSQLIVDGSLSVPKITMAGIATQYAGYFTIGSGIRELFRVAQLSLSTGGTFTITATRGGFVHSSQWAWSSTHNSAGQGVLTQLSCGAYVNIPVYLDVAAAGDVIICANWGDTQGYYITIQQTGGQGLSVASAGTDWSTVASGYTRYTATSISNGFQTNNAQFNGNVGIGTASPASGYRLDVRGNLFISQASATARLTLDQSGVRGWYIDNTTGGNLTFTSGDGSGNIGMGTSSPSTNLHVTGVGADGYGTFYCVNTNNAGYNEAGAKFVNYYGNHSYGIVADFSIATLTDRAAISFSGGQATHTWTVGYYYSNVDTFGIVQNRGTTYSSWGTPRLVIDTSGNVGIGTTSPERKLHVEGTVQLGNQEHLAWAYDDGGYYNYITNTYGTTDPCGLIYRSGSWTSSTAYSAHTFQTSESSAWVTRLVIFGNGNVGIGTTSPGSKLDVVGTITANGSRPIVCSPSLGNIYIQGDAGGWENGYWFKGSAGTAKGGFGVLGGGDSVSYFFIGDSYTNPTAVFAPGGGNVGIGTTAPSTKLDVKKTVGAGAAAGSIIRATTTDGLGVASFGYGFYVDSTGHELATITATYNSSAGGGTGLLNINTLVGGTIASRINIDYTGNVGIGTTNPSTLLHVNGTVTATAFSGPLTGNVTGNCSGSSGSCTGNAATASVLSGRVAFALGSSNWDTAFTQCPVSSKTYGGDFSSGGPTGTWWFQENMRHSNASSYWGTQIAWGWEDNANQLYQRNVCGGSWSGWVRYLNSGNYNSYSPTLTGGGASGTWGISVTGNAATATKLATARTIGGVSFDGSADITVASATGGFAMSQNSTGAVATIRNTNSSGYSGIEFLDYGGTSDAYIGLECGGGAVRYNSVDGSAPAHKFYISSTEKAKVDSTGVVVTGAITATGDITAYYSSDRRLKENIYAIPSALDKLEKIRGVEFDWNAEYLKTLGPIDGYFVRKHNVGVIAQEVEALLPEVVATRDDGYKAVRYELLAPLMIEAIKELKEKHGKEIAALKGEIERLKGENDGIHY